MTNLRGMADAVGVAHGYTLTDAKLGRSATPRLVSNRRLIRPVKYSAAVPAFAHITRKWLTSPADRSFEVRLHLIARGTARAARNTEDDPSRVRAA